MNKYYLKEFTLFDGEYDVTFNILDVNFNNHTIKVAIGKAGKISVIEFDLFENENGWYFKYGCMLEKININDFEEVQDEM